jgi:hypothetical protein
MHLISLSESAIRWTLPETGFDKFNVDAAVPNNDGKWGLAAVIRDVEGCVVAAACLVFVGVTII